MSNRPWIALRGAAFGYGGQRVVSDIDLELRPGSFVGVLGPNASGKTTLLRGILGLLPPRAGTVEREEAVLGYVPQRENLDPVYPVTVEEVVQMGAYGRLSGWRGLPRSEREGALHALDRVGLLPRRRQLFASLSGGQRQRALIARALVTRPDVLLLDEPTSGVDGPTRALIRDLLTRLNREEDLAIVIVSHQVSMTRAMHEVLWMQDGRARRGTPEEVLDPATLDEIFARPAGASPAPAEPVRAGPGVAGGPGGPGGPGDPEASAPPARPRGGGVP